MKYRIILTLLAAAVFAFVFLSKDDTVQRATPSFQPPPGDEPAMKGLQIN